VFGFDPPRAHGHNVVHALGLDALAAELEQPFGYTENVLPLDALVRTVEREVLAELGSQPLAVDLRKRHPKPDVTISTKSI
jgi:predicted membrane chloride channel (bestrophin family)